MSNKILPDVQLTKPKHEIAINRVGISDFKMPIFISQKDGGVQHSVANISCYVDLAPDIKGISMSRIPIGLMKFAKEQLCSKIMIKIAENIRRSTEADLCDLGYYFTYFLTKFAPVSCEPGILPYDVWFNVIKTKDDYLFRFTIETITSSSCPCSKEISQFGAHNQKSRIKITCQGKKEAFIWIEDIIEIAEASASCEIYSVLKRPDEKVVTERMYENSKFVEDIARSCYVKLSEKNNIEKFKVEVSNDESIHAHLAKAIISNY